MSRLNIVVIESQISAQAKTILRGLLSSLTSQVRYEWDESPDLMTPTIFVSSSPKKHAIIKFPVYLKEKEKFRFFERSVLHEPYHQYQHENGYLRIISKDKSSYVYKTLSTTLSSYVLDQNIYLWMKYLSYDYIEDDYIERYDRLMANANTLFENLYEFSSFPATCCTIAHNLSQSHAFELLKLYKIKMIKEYYSYSQIYQLIELIGNYDYGSSVTCNALLSDFTSIFSSLTLSSSYKASSPSSLSSG